MRLIFASLTLAGSAVAAMAAQGPPPAGDLARRLQAHYSTVRDFKADFTSTARGGVLPQTTYEKGTVLVKKPGRMRWTFTGAEKKDIVADGTTIFTWLHADRQVFVNPIPKGDDASTALLFLMGRGDLNRDFTPSLAPTQPEGEWQLVLAPKSPQADFVSLTLIIDRQSLALLGFMTVDSDGGTATWRFSNLKENAGLPDSEFVFPMPKGVEVIRK
jgi:outer membrane lipoprotein carrier protein